MALQECGLNLNSVSKELQPHGNLAFPCAGYASRHTDRPEDSIPWHWHEEIEIIYIESGQIEVKIPSQSFLLKKRDCLVINANIVHYATAVPEGSLHSLVFSPALISGKEDSVFSQKYISPLISCPASVFFCIRSFRRRWICRRLRPIRTTSASAGCSPISTSILPTPFPCRISQRKPASVSGNVCAASKKQSSSRPSSIY